MSELSVGIIIAVTVSPVVFVILLIVFIKVVCFGKRESIDLNENFDGLSESLSPAKLYHKNRRGTAAYSGAYLRTPPRLKRGRVWLTRMSKDVYHIAPKKKDQSKQNNVVGERITRSSLPTSDVPQVPEARSSWTSSPYQSVQDTSLYSRAEENQSNRYKYSLHTLV